MKAPVKICTSCLLTSNAWHLIQFASIYRARSSLGLSVVLSVSRSANCLGSTPIGRELGSDRGSAPKPSRWSLRDRRAGTSLHELMTTHRTELMGPVWPRSEIGRFLFSSNDWIIAND